MFAFWFTGCDFERTQFLGYNMFPFFNGLILHKNTRCLDLRSFSSYLAILLPNNGGKCYPSKTDWQDLNFPKLGALDHECVLHYVLNASKYCIGLLLNNPTGP